MIKSLYKIPYHGSNYSGCFISWIIIGRLVAIYPKRAQFLIHAGKPADLTSLLGSKPKWLRIGCTRCIGGLDRTNIKAQQICIPYQWLYFPEIVPQLSQ